MNNVKTFSIPSKNIFLEQDNGSQLLKTKFFAIAEGDNLNKSSFLLSSIDECISTNDYVHKPVLGAWDSTKLSSNGIGDFDGHNSDVKVDAYGNPYNVYLGEKNERPLGLILPNSAKIEDYKGKKWLSFEGAIWVEYNREAVELLRKKRTNSVSVEIRVLKSHEDDRGYEIIEKFSLLGITVIGVKPGIENANLVLDYTATQQYSNFVTVFSQKISEIEGLENKMEFLKKDDYGTGPSLTIDFSKESASNDAWGSISKSNLRNALLKAKNYKSLIPKSYLVVEEGWEAAPSEKLKYPFIQVKSDKVVLNINGVQAASSRLMQFKDEPYFSSAKAKLNKVRKILGMDKLMSFGIESNNNWGDIVEQNQPDTIKMEKEGKGLMSKKEIVSKMSGLFADKEKLEKEKEEMAVKLEEAEYTFATASEDDKADAGADVDAKKSAMAEKDKTLLENEKSLLSAAKDLMQFLEKDADKPQENVEDEYYDAGKFGEILTDGCHYVSSSKSYVIYEKDNEVFAVKYASDADGKNKKDGEAVKLEKAYAQFLVGGTLSVENTVALPPMMVEVTKGFASLFANLKSKDDEIAKNKSTGQVYIDKVKSLMSKFEDISCVMSLPKEYRAEVQKNIFDDKFADEADLEKTLKSKMYDINSSQALMGKFPNVVEKQSTSEKDKYDDILNKIVKK